MTYALNWVITQHRSPDQIGYRAYGLGVEYTIIQGKGGACVLSSMGDRCIGPFHYADEATAKQAARDDFAAAIREAARVIPLTPRLTAELETWASDEFLHWPKDTAYHDDLDGLLKQLRALIADPVPPAARPWSMNGDGHV